MMIPLLLACVPLGWIFYNMYCLLINYRQACQLNIPTVCILVSTDNPIWIALQTAFSTIFRYLPFKAFSLTRYSQLGWEFYDRAKTHERLGDVWILVTPDKNWLHVAEAEAAYDIFSRGREFGRPVWMLEMLNVFGPNVSTAEGPDWQRQRKLTATPFNERTSNFVWAEALRQATDMIDLWLNTKAEGLKSTSEDTRTLALHVLAYAGFQRSHPFKSIARDTGTQKPNTYRDSLSIILRNVLVILVLPSWLMNLPFLPSKWTRIGLAVTNFRRHMMDQLADEKRLLAEGKPGSGTLMSNLVRASDAAPDTDGKATPNGRAHDLKALSIDEILGNIFVFNFAGHDTTATTLGYSMFLLVAHPEVQDWISEELNFHIKSDNYDDWKYEIVFPKLKRCLAVMLETLRLYNPLPGIPKYTGDQIRTLQAGHRQINIPPNTLVVANLNALHTLPQYWGEDALEWRPSRWITSSSETQGKDLSTRLSQESLLKPQKGTYIAWSEGTRNCPGKKFAQVEFVATMAALFRSFHAWPVVQGGETMEDARVRVLAAVKDSYVELLLRMRDPESVLVAWGHR